MNRSRLAFSLLLPVLFLGVAGCDPAGIQNIYDLTFEGDASFQGPHGGQDIYLVVESSVGGTVASATGTVSATETPAFSFTFDRVLLEGVDFVVKYWIDSNFGDTGVPGACDPPSVDHQWRVPITSVAGHRTLTEPHQPGVVESVCDAFTTDLTFRGDDSFQSAHGGNDVTIAVVRETVDGTTDRVVATETTTVSSTGDLSFSADFPGLLVVGAAYHVAYWIDSNFQGGEDGVCGSVSDDEQWRVDVGPVEDEDEPVTVTDAYRPSEVQSVCSTFE